MTQGFAGAGLTVLGSGVLAISAPGASLSNGTLLISNAHGVSWGMAGSTLTASVAGGAALTNINVSAGSTSQNLSNIVVSNSNGMGWGLNGSTITGSYTRNVASNAIQSVGSATGSGTNTSRFAADDHVHAGVFSMGASSAGNTAGNTRVDVGQFVFQGGNNITLSQITAANALNTLIISAGNAGGGAQTGISGIQVSDTTYTSGTVTLRNLNGISFGSSGANGISASYTVPTVTNSSLTLSDAATSILIGKLAFSQSNGLTLSLSTTTGGSATLVGSYTVPTLTNSTLTISDAATSIAISRLAFSQSNGLTLSLSTTTGGSATVVGSYTQSGQAVSAQGGSSTFSTLVFTNSNNVSFSNTGGSVWGSYALNVSATGGTSNALSGLTFKDANGLSFGLSTGAGVGTLTGSHNGITSQTNQQMSMFAASNTTQSSSGTANASSHVFAGAGAASVGVTGGSVVVSVPALVTHTLFDPYRGIPWDNNGQQGGSVYLLPMAIPNVQFDRIVIGLSNSNATGSSGSGSLSEWFGIYTRNGSSLSLLTSQSTTTGISHSGTVGNYSLMSGIRLFSLGLTTTLTEGEYVFAFISSSSTSGSNFTCQAIVLQDSGAVSIRGWMGSSQNNSYQNALGSGLYSVTTQALPNPIGYSEVVATRADIQHPPWFLLHSSTV